MAGIPELNAISGNPGRVLDKPRMGINKPGPGIPDSGYRGTQLVKVGSPPRTGATRPLGSSQSSCRPSAVMSRKV
jgi:hypothetical protein